MHKKILYASYYTHKDIKNYKKIPKEIKKENDTRKTKKSKEFQKNEPENNINIIGPRFLKLQKIREKFNVGKILENKKNTKMIF